MQQVQNTHGKALHESQETIVHSKPTDSTRITDRTNQRRAATSPQQMEPLSWCSGAYGERFLSPEPSKDAVLSVPLALTAPSWAFSTESLLFDFMLPRIGNKASAIFFSLLPSSQPGEFESYRAALMTWPAFPRPTPPHRDPRESRGRSTHSPPASNAVRSLLLPRHIPCM